MTRSTPLFVLLLSSVVPASYAAETAVRPPREQLSSVPTRIDDIPTNWATAKPLRLQVCFNTKFAVNSSQANEFLRQWYRSIHGMPFAIQLRMERAIYPAQFAYCASLTFANWQVYRKYETSAVFLQYYHDIWQPAVTDATEQLTVLDTQATAR